MSDIFLGFLNLLKLGDEKAWRKAFNFLYPIAWRAACVLGYSKSDAENVAFDTLMSLPYKIGLWKIQKKEDLHTRTTVEVYLRCLPFLEGLREGILKKWKEMLERNQVETEQKLYHFIYSFREIKEIYLTDLEKVIFTDRWLLKKDNTYISKERSIEEAEVQSILFQICRKMKSGLEEYGLGWVLIS